LSDKYGVECDEEQSAFPTLAALGAATEEDFKALGTGFRAKYLTDCVHRLSDGEIDLNALIDTDIATARSQLIKIKGVGPKVADCVLLFSLRHRSAFPIDVWVKRVMSALYFDGEEQSVKTIAEFADKKWGKLAGYAQQYLFYFARSGGIDDILNGERD
jgi:N-glycosylase/DNA lyase